SRFLPRRWPANNPIRPGSSKPPDARSSTGRRSLPQRLSSGEASGGAQVFLDAQKLVVFGDAVGTARRAGLDLAGIGRYHQVGNERVLGFTRAVRDDRRVTGVGGH